MEKDEIQATLQKTFQLFRDYCAEIAGDEATKDWIKESHSVIREYFKNLDKFLLDEQAELQKLPEEISDKEVLAFSVWMQQFMNQLKAAYIGIGKINVESITQPVQPALEELGFYSFYEQAQELIY